MATKAYFVTDVAEEFYRNRYQDVLRDLKAVPDEYYQGLTYDELLRVYLKPQLMQYPIKAPPKVRF